MTLMAGLDRFDRKILDALQRDGRITNAELAREVGLSPTPCWRRVKRLENDGVIGHYAAVLDPGRLGLDISVFVYVTLDLHQAEAFEQVIRDRAEVVNCYAMTGDQDYLLHVMLPDIHACDRFLREELIHMPGVASVRTSLALKTIKQTASLPIAFAS